MSATAFVPLSQVKAHLKLVRKREKQVFAPGSYIEQKTELLNTKFNREQLNSLMGDLQDADNFESALMSAREIASVFQQAADGLAACKKGCSDCCNIPVMVTSAEAQVIAKRIGRELSVPKVSHQAAVMDDIGSKRLAAVSNKRYTGTPCPFKSSAGACSIYEERPLPCRLQFNMDNDNLLCKLVPKNDVHVPYLNAFQVELALMARIALDPVYSQQVTVADIRDWFSS